MRRSDTQVGDEQSPRELGHSDALLAANGDGLDSGKLKRGRRPANESQAAAIRGRLIAWKQTPEGQRVSLRALAIELGTSHQLVSFYLKSLSDWQKNHYKQRAKAICDQARAEKRCLTAFEQAQVVSLGRAEYQWMIDAAMGPVLKKLEEQAAAGQLSGQVIRVVSVLAQRGIPEAQKIMKQCRNKPRKDEATLRKEQRLNAVFQATDSEEAVRLITQLTPEEREELRALWEKRRNNLPVHRTARAKSFRGAYGPNLTTPL